MQKKKKKKKKPIYHKKKTKNKKNKERTEYRPKYWIMNFHLGLVTELVLILAKSFYFSVSLFKSACGDLFTSEAFRGPPSVLGPCKYLHVCL
jgi:hypothetical protein